MWPITLAALALLLCIARPRYERYSVILGSIGIAILVAAVLPFYLRSRHAHVFYSTDAAGKPVAHARFWVNVEESSPWDFMTRKRQIELFSDSAGEVWFVSHGPSHVAVHVSAQGTPCAVSVSLTGLLDGAQCDQLGSSSYAYVSSNIIADPDGRFHVVIRFPGDPVFNNLMAQEAQRVARVQALSAPTPTTRRSLPASRSSSSTSRASSRTSG
jgi:hypothetical protein